MCLAGGADVPCATCEVVGQWAEVLFVEGVEDVGAVGWREGSDEVGGYEYSVG